MRPRNKRSSFFLSLGSQENCISVCTGLQHAYRRAGAGRGEVDWKQWLLLACVLLEICSIHVLNSCRGLLAVSQARPSRKGWDSCVCVCSLLFTGWRPPIEKNHSTHYASRLFSPSFSLHTRAQTHRAYPNLILSKSLVSVEHCVGFVFHGDWRVG